MNIWITLLLAAVASAQTPAIRDPKTNAAEGKELFTAKCALCHGQDGQGKPAMAKMFSVPAQSMNLILQRTTKKTDNDLKAVVLNGRGKMPAFKDKLKDAEISAVLGYIRSLAAGSKAASPKTRKN